MNTRLERFKSTWSPDHQARVLGAVGLSVEAFNALGPNKQRHALNKAIEKRRQQPAQTQQQNSPAAVTRPLTPTTLDALASRLAEVKYGSAENQLAQQQRAVQPWFQNYVSTIQGAQQRTAQMQQPAIDQANQAAANQTVTPGIDPNSQAGHDDALAAAGRMALLKLGAQSLQAMQGAGTNFFGEQQAIAPMYEQQVTQQLGNQMGQLQREKGADRAVTLNDLRTQERQFGLDSRHQAVEEAAFNVDTQNTLDDNEQQAATPNKWGFTAAEWSSFTPAKRQRIMKRQAGFGKSPGKPGDHYGFTDAEWAGMSHAAKVKAKGEWQKSGRSGPTGEPTPKDIARANDQWKRATSGAKKYRTAFDNEADLYSFLLDKYQSLDPDILRAAAQLAVTKKLGPGNRAALRKMGVKLPKVVKRPPTTGGTVQQGAAGYPYGTGAGMVH